MIDIDQLIKEATLSKDKVALNAYKNIKAEFEKFVHAQILERRITEDISIRIIASYSKKLEDAIKQFSEAHRDDLVSEYTSELEVVKKLLPEPVNELEIYIELAQWMLDNKYINIEKSDEELRENEIYKAKSVQVGQIPKKEMGAAIKFLKSKFPTADGKMISEIVKKYTV